MKQTDLMEMKTPVWLWRDASAGESMTHYYRPLLCLSRCAPADLSAPGWPSMTWETSHIFCLKLPLFIMQLISSFNEQINSLELVGLQCLYESEINGWWSCIVGRMTWGQACLPAKRQKAHDWQTDFKGGASLGWRCWILVLEGNSPACFHPPPTHLIWCDLIMQKVWEQDTS